MADVVVVGSYNQDHVWRTPRFPAPGETRLGEFASGPGGKGFNQAVSAARQGAAVSFIGAFGRDAIADFALSLARAEGIDTRCEIRDDAASGTAAILVEHAGQNLIVVGPGANLLLSIEHVEAQASVIGTARVVVTQHEIHMAATRRALELARASGTLTVHNPAPPLADEDGSLLDRVDVLTPNESEFAHLLSRMSGREVSAAEFASLDDDALHALCRELRVPTVVLTLGARGVFVSHDADDTRGDDMACYRIAAERVAPIDTTGAGDAFTGALAAGLARGGAFRDAVCHANRCAGMSTEKHGAASAMPRRDDVTARFP